MNYILAENIKPKQNFGSFEQNGSAWLYHTPAGYITLKDGIHHYFARDYQGSTRAVYRENQRATPGYVGQQNSTTYAIDVPSVTISTYTLDERMSYFASGLPYRRDYDSDAPTDHLHLGKPWLDLDGISLYNNSARLHDPITATFITQDPLANNYTTISPYANTPGNPVNAADYNGLKPNEFESALMSKWIYDQDDLETLADLGNCGWALSSMKLPFKSNSDDNSLNGALFSREIDGEIEYAYVFAGTQHLRDYADDFLQFFGFSKQHYDAASQAEMLSEILGKNTELTFVGHSLGASEATLAGLTTGRDVIGFNPAQLSYATILANGKFKQANIDQYISTNRYLWTCADFITLLQAPLIGTISIGTIHPIYVSPMLTHSIDCIVESLRPKK